MRKPFVAGNWKMNTDSHSSVSLAEGLASGAAELKGQNVDIAVFPPLVYLESIIYWLYLCLVRSFGTSTRYR
jgi:triosephosphate isomerase